ncbi:Protein phosphatase PP2A regulatory subunit B, partial [Mortierella alpina]
SASLYIGELDPSVNEALLFELFIAVGPVASIRVCRDAVTRRSLGYAYVNFHNVADGERALEALNYTLIKNRPCRIMWSQRDPALRKTGTGNIFIKNLDAAIDNKALHDTFSVFGNILSCKVVTENDGQSRGYGFVHYQTNEAAENAIKHVNGMLLNDKKVYVGHHVSKKERQSKAEEMKARFTNIYIKNLDTDATEEEVKALFTKFGPVTSCVVVRDSRGLSKGFGFVNFENHEDASRAVDELHDSDYRGKKLFVTRAQKKSEREEELRRQYEQQKMEKLNKYQGINLYVKNLDDDIDDERLRQEFSVYGVITSAKVMREEKTDGEGEEDSKSVSKGFGFVCFSSPDEATKAVTEMNGRMLGSKPIYVALAQRKEIRQSQLEAQMAQRNQLRIQTFPVQTPGGIYPPQLFYPSPGGFPSQDRGMIYSNQPRMVLRPRWIGVSEQQPVPAGVNLPGYGYQPAYMTRLRPPQGQRRMGGRTNAAAATAAEVDFGSLTAAALAAADPDRQKQMVGEHLYPQVVLRQPSYAGKITGLTPMALHDDHAVIAKLLELIAHEASTRFETTEAQRQTLPLRPFPTLASLSRDNVQDDSTVTIDPATSAFLAPHLQQLSSDGSGLELTVQELVSRIGPSLANSAGPRYFGLVTGGVTPAAFLADWIVTMYDQNTILDSVEHMSGYSVITDQAMKMVLDLFSLPREVLRTRVSANNNNDDESGGDDGREAVVAGEPYLGETEGIFRAMTTTGSTASNIVGMAVGRQWLGKYVRGVDYTQDGYDGQVVVLTNMAHATVWKAASILGIGRRQVMEVPSMGGKEDPQETVLEQEVLRWKNSGKAVMVFLSFGEVNTGIFPRNTRRIAEICRKNQVYFHIDGAFGIYARCSPKYAHLADGLELADSITACGHKWLNVPYDCGLFLYRRSLEKTIMEPLFSSSAAYLRPSDSPFSHPMNISIENSQRFRALPVWATLKAYGREGYRRIVEENCRFAKTMYSWMKETRPDLYTVLTEECPLNIVVFSQTPPQSEKEASSEVLEKRNVALLNRINHTGVAYFSPTVWNGLPAIRAAISNWKTTVELDWEPVRAMLEEQGAIRS